MVEILVVLWLTCVLLIFLWLLEPGKKTWGFTVLGVWTILSIFLLGVAISDPEPDLDRYRLKLIEQSGTVEVEMDEGENLFYARRFDVTVDGKEMIMICYQTDSKCEILIPFLPTETPR